MIFSSIFLIIPFRLFQHVPNIMEQTRDQNEFICGRIWPHIFKKKRVRSHAQKMSFIMFTDFVSFTGLIYSVQNAGIKIAWSTIFFVVKKMSKSESSNIVPTQLFC